MRRTCAVGFAVATATVAAITLAALPASASTSTTVGHIVTPSGAFHVRGGSAISPGQITEDEFVGTGGGTISPGLGLTPAPQAFNFAGRGTSTGTGGVPAVASCDATGDDEIGTVELGEGNATVTCDFGTDHVVAPVTFIRAGAVVWVEGFGVLWNFDAICLFTPGQLTPPVTTYTLVCAGRYRSIEI